MGKFLDSVERFLADHGMAPSAFGHQALNDQGFVRGLRSGRSPRIDTVERVKAWMDAYDRANPVPAREARKKREREIERQVRRTVAAELGRGKRGAARARA